MSRFVGAGASADAGHSIFSISDEDRSELYQSRFFYSYQQRGFHSSITKHEFFSLWPRSYFACGDPTAPAAYLGQDQSDIGGQYEFGNVYECAGSSVRFYFMRGLVTDSSSNIYAGANVFMFLTSTNQLVSSGVSDQNGNYSLPTPYNAAHYVVAQYSNTLVGTTLNTITPAL